MNMAGMVVLLLGVFIFIVAIRGTQANVFPFFFSNTGGNGSGQGPTPGSHCIPPTFGICPAGYTMVAGQCCGMGL